MLFCNLRLVTKTISEAVLENIFSEAEVKSIFNWDNDSRGSTPYSSYSPKRSSIHTPKSDTHHVTFQEPSHDESHGMAVN